MSNKENVFAHVWERINNAFNSLEFEGIRNEAGRNSFCLSARNWIDLTRAIGWVAGGIWESVFNPNFNYGGFAIIKSQAGLNSYKISVKEWVTKTYAIGLRATAGRYGGNLATEDGSLNYAL